MYSGNNNPSQWFSLSTLALPEDFVDVTSRVSPKDHETGLFRFDPKYISNSLQGLARSEVVVVLVADSLLE